MRLSFFLRIVLTIVFGLLAGKAGEAGAQVHTNCVGGACGGTFTITPDGGTMNVPANTSGQNVSFLARNGGTSPVTVNFSCQVTGNVTCTSLDMTSYTFDAGEQVDISATFSTGAAGSGTITLVGSGGGSDQGYYNVTIQDPPPPSAATLALRNANGSNSDRGLCLTVGAGEAAGISCGDLIVTHGMPAYRALGRDRSLSLLYNSAASTGLVLVAADVGQPSGTSSPLSTKAILTVGTAKDSAQYNPVAPGNVQQIVLGRGITGLATGVYPMTLLFRNIYSGSVLDTTVSGSVLVVNRSASEYGKGWSLLGVEQVLTDPNDSTRRVWLAGDASIRVYQRGTTLTSGMLSQSGLSAFTAANIVDGNTATQGWHTDAAVAGAWLQEDLATPQTVTTVSTYAASTGNTAIWNIQYSDNGSSWTTAYPGYRPISGWTQVSWASKGAHRYWRLYLTNTPGPGSWMNELSFGNASTFYGAPGDAPDSLVRFDTLGTKWYRRDLKHGAAVVFDQNGRHQFTRNRVGARTTFNWGTVAGQTRLTSIYVPPNDVARIFNLYWNSSTALLDSIKDPGVRRLKTTITSGLLMSLTDADNQVTRFNYTGNLLTRRIYPRKGMKGDSAYTTFSYANSARVTGFGIQTDSAAAFFANTVVTPWDEKGLAQPFASTSFGAITVAGLSTGIDGPISGTGDAVDIWVDGFGQPTTTNNIGLSTKVSIWRDSLSLPGLATRIQYPDPTTTWAGGRVVRMSWNGRGNLTETVDSTYMLDSRANKVTTYTYADGTSPDSPTRVQDGLGRHTDYAYTSLGLTDSIIDPRSHRTKFFYISSGFYTGLPDSIAERQIETWVQNSGTESTLDQTARFTYDTNGNPKTATSPAGAVTSYTADATGRITDVYDPLKTRTGYTYDNMNRVLGTTFYTTAQTHPTVPNPLLGCVTTQFLCADSTAPFRPALAATLVTSYAYTTSGLVDSILDPRNVKRKYIYDARLQVKRERDEFNKDKIAFFNVNGLLDSVRSRDGFATRFRYDATGRRTAMIFPSRNNVFTFGTQLIPGDSISYSYDLLGQVLQTKNSAGNTITRTYWGDGAPKSKKTVHGFTDSLYYQYDITGAKTQMIAAGQDSVNYIYNGTTGDLDSMRVWMDSVTTGATGGFRTFKFTYDGLGRRRQITYPKGSIAKYYYDAIGVLRKVLSTNPKTPVGTDRLDFTFASDMVDPVGHQLHQRIDCNSFNGADPVQTPCGGTVTQNTDNRYDRRGSLVFQLIGTQRDSLHFDASGNIVYRSQSAGGYPGRDSMVIIANSNRISYDTNYSTHYRVNFTYDTSGNRTLESPTSQAQGNITLWKWQYYDALGRNTGYQFVKWNGSGFDYVIHPTDCMYDPEGGIRKPCPNAASQVSLDGANTSAAIDGWRFVSAPGTDEFLMGRYALGTSRRELYFVMDGSGRQLAVADSLGTIQDLDLVSIDQGEWQFAGGTQNGSGFNATRMGNADQPGVSYFRNRAYDSRTGRWMQEDPIGAAGGVNLYQYNGNNPVTYTDPFGLCPGGLSPGKSLLCNSMEATSTAIGLLGGFALGAGAGALEIVGSGGILAPVAAVGLATTTAAGGAIGLKAGQALTSQLFARSSDDLPSRGKPNSSTAKDNGGGKGQIREYGPDGKATKDFDFGHDHGAGDPHAHDWNWNKTPARQPGRPILPGE